MESSSQCPEAETEVDKLRKLLHEKDEEINQLKEELTEYGKMDEDTASSSELTGFASLPPEILIKIFKIGLDVSELRNCRLVCKTWKSAIDNCPELIGRMTFDILEARTFLESSLVGKVQSVRFLVPLMGSIEVLGNFFTRMGLSVRKIDLAFVSNEGTKVWTDSWKWEREKLMFALVMGCSTELRELTISTSNRHFIRELTDLEVELVGSRISWVSVNIHNLTKIEILDLGAFLFSLEGLQFLKLSSHFHSFIEIENSDTNNCLIDLICQLIERSDGYLKEIDTTDIFWGSVNTCDRRLKLVLTAGRCGLSLHETDDEIDLNALLNYREIFGMRITNQCCRGIRNGKLRLGQGTSDVKQERLCYCGHLEDLVVTLCRMATPEDFPFFPYLKKLKFLTLADAIHHHDRGNATDTLIPSAVFGSGIPSLKVLRLNGNVFGSDYSWLHFYLPNLTELYISSCGYFPQDVIRDLSKLTKLESLSFESRVALTDDMLIQPCEVYREAVKVTVVPAIAAFSKLKGLKIRDCALLSDNCLINGISCSQTLDFVELKYREEQFTKTGIESLPARITLRLNNQGC